MKVIVALTFMQLCLPSYLCASVKNDVTTNFKVDPMAPTVIVDVDAGADDAAAILTLLGTGANVLAITCVNGNTPLDNVVANVFKTLDTAGRLDIPVYRGAYEALLGNQPSDDFFGTDGFGDFEYGDLPDIASLLKKEHAVTALVDIVNRNPGKVSLLCLGPLTNVALAAKMDPKFMSKVKDIVVMGGSVEGIGNKAPGIEFNFHMDATAAHIVFSYSNKLITLIPWETVLRSNVSKEWRINSLGQLDRPTIKLLNMAERKSLGSEGSQWICSDCIAAAVFRDPHLIQKNSMYYGFLPLEGHDTQGLILIDYANNFHKSPNVNIVQEISVDNYEKLLYFFL